ncbi:MAG: tyrosine-type recombinase/integrase [Bryobacteraceae bacterium]
MLPEPLTKPDIRYLLSVGRHMARDRFQKGYIEDTSKSGAKKPKWKGHYWIYERQADGSEKRVHKSTDLGPKKALRKWEAEKRLEQHIEKQTKQSTGSTITVSSRELTVRWFFENRFRPMMEPKWKESSRKELIGNIERYVLRLIGDTPLVQLDKFMLQMHANELAQKYSESVVEKYMVWTNAILEEALDQDLIAKNPARKLEKPQTRPVNKRTAKEPEIRVIMQCMEGQVRLVLMISFVLGLRPGEVLALRWDDVFDGALRIDEATRYGKIYSPKSDASAASVWLPAEMKAELEIFRPKGAKLSDFIFPNTLGKPYRLDNFRKRLLKPALEQAKEKARSLGLEDSESLKEITFQVCRRSCGTLMQRHGNVKDIQAHLRHAQASTTARGVHPADTRERPERCTFALQGVVRRGAGKRESAVNMRTMRTSARRKPRSITTKALHQLITIDHDFDHLNRVATCRLVCVGI